MRYALEADVRNVIVSHPRSGTTWLQALLGRYLCYVYDLPEELTMRSQPLTRAGRLPVLAFTHDPQRREPGVGPIATDYAGRRIALLVRDPRDVAVSLYLVRHYRHEDPDADGPLAPYVRRVLPRILAFYEAWLEEGPGAVEAFVTVAYEDLHRDAAAELMRLVRLFGYEEAEPQAIRAARFASFENMQRLESTGRFHVHYQVNDMVPMDDLRARRTRAGEVGGYRRYLDADTATWAAARIYESPHLGARYGRQT